MVKVPNSVIKIIAYTGMGFITYQYYQVWRLESKVIKLKALQESQIQRGEPISVPPELQDAQVFMSNHFGNQLQQRLLTTHVIEEQITYAINKRNEQKSKLDIEADKETLEKIDEELKRLNELFSKIKGEQQQKA
ncbi:hypothetical protein pb186bvf_005127 [Paramecium bursaria]